jgi:hypothetical protein
MKTRYSSDESILLKIILGSSVSIVFLIIYLHYGSISSDYSKIPNLNENNQNGLNLKVKKQINNTTVIGLVFYGRERQFSILYRYLLPNLKVNGGVLDKIIFAVRTDKKSDLGYLDAIMKQNHSYFERVFLTNQNFVNFYHMLKDDDLVFKIDDDIVFISNGTFERMLDEYLNNNGFILSANVINHPLLSIVHARIRAILPFVESNNNTWIWDEKTLEIDKTVGYGIKYEVGTAWWNSGKNAALAHSSFLYHALKNNLDVYDFKRWDFHSEFYGRWSINFILSKGRFLNRIIEGDDEEWISNHVMRRYGRHGYALGSAVVCHFSYNYQKEYLYSTNILEKYDNLSKIYLGLN